MLYQIFLGRISGWFVLVNFSILMFQCDFFVTITDSKAGHLNIKEKGFIALRSWLLVSLVPVRVSWLHPNMADGSKVGGGWMGIEQLPPVRANCHLTNPFWR